MKRLYLMITITNRVMGSKRFVDFYRAFGAPVVFTALGRGTASDEVLSYLGLEATEKSVMLSVVTPACKEVLMKELVRISIAYFTQKGKNRFSYQRSAKNFQFHIDNFPCQWYHP